MPLPSGMDGNDGWNRVHGGFRSDWDLTADDALVVEGDLFSNHEGQTRLSSLLPSPLNHEFRQDFAAQGENILGRWTHQLSGGSELSLQAYYDGYRRTDFGVEESVSTFDFDFQYHTHVGERHDVVWGTGYRRGASSLSPGHQLGFDPPSRADSLFSAFVQDEMKLAQSLWLTIGSRFEHNSYDGFEYEPSIRLAWTPNPKHTVWASVARAIRQPARVEVGMRDTLAVYPEENGVTSVVTLSGNPNFKAEQLREVDAGYRSQITPTLSLDVAAYYGHYRDLETYGQLPAIFMPAPQPTITIPMYYANQANASNCGGEISFNWKITPRWQISPGYSLTRLIMRNNPGSTGSYDVQIPEHTPKHMFQVRSYVNLTRKLDFDNSLYWIERMPGLNIGNQARVDSRLAWRVGETTELSVVGQNLLRPRQLEFGDSWGVAGTQVLRSIYGQIRWHF